MRKITLFTQKELEELAIREVSRIPGDKFTFKRWELEISTDSYPKLWIYYVNCTSEFCKVVQLELPK